MPLAAVMSQEDACELLNLCNFTLRPVTDAGILTFERIGKAMWIGKGEVLALASSLIAPAEIAARLGLHPSSVGALMRRNRRIPKMPGGWSRPDFVRLLS